jgi:menaquinone-dependent protoporphyrinogen oxidase
MNKILILFSTTDGHTYDICKKIKSVISNNQGGSVDLVALKDNPFIAFNKYDKLIIGASIRYGKHNPEVYKFIEENHGHLDAIDNSFFSVNVVARKPEKSTPETNPYMVKFLKEIAWKPKRLAVFGGRLDYPKYGFWDRTMIRFIMWMTKGPTEANTVVEYTDWENVEKFAMTFVEEKQKATLS